MKKVFLAAVLAVAGMAVFGQEKPRLGILPFTGGSGRDGDTVAMLFSGSRDLMDTFSIVPRTSNVEAVMKEQDFQRSGLTDSDTIAELGKQMNAQYVVSGHIARLGKTNLLLISIVEVDTMRQITGDYREYETIEGIPQLLPAMARNIIASIQNQTAASAETLAVLPLLISDPAVQEGDAELLAQILATEIANSGKYAVFPRTKTIETVMTEQAIQRSGMTDRASMAAIGKATNAKYVLSGTITRLGVKNLFSIAILEVATAEQTKAAYKEYQNLEDGIELMGTLAYGLTGVEAGRYREGVLAAEQERQQAADTERRAREAADAERRREEQARRKAEMDRAFKRFLRGDDGKRLTGIGINGAFNGLSVQALINVNAVIPLTSALVVEAGVSFGLTPTYIAGVGLSGEGEGVTGYRLTYPYVRLTWVFYNGDMFKWYLGAGIGSWTESYTYTTSTWAYNVYSQESVNISEIPPNVVFGVFIGEGHHLIRIAIESIIGGSFSVGPAVGYTYRIY